MLEVGYTILWGRGGVLDGDNTRKGSVDRDLYFYSLQPFELEREEAVIGGKEGTRRSCATFV